MTTPLDPLLLKLALNYSDQADLSNRLQKLFTVSIELDMEENGLGNLAADSSLGFCRGPKRLDMTVIALLSHCF